MIENICKTCEAIFTKPHNPNRVYKYCSLICMGGDKEKQIAHSKMMKGSLPWNNGDKGRKNWHNISGLKPGWNKGKKGLQVAWNKGILNFAFCGENNPMWKGGITPINEQIRKSIQYKQWRTSVFERDDYTCTECGDNTGGNLEADHIKPFAYYPALRFVIDNGKTLCKSCHKKTDTYLNKSRWSNFHHVATA